MLSLYFSLVLLQIKLLSGQYFCRFLLFRSLLQVANLSTAFLVDNYNIDSSSFLVVQHCQRAHISIFQQSNAILDKDLAEVIAPIFSQLRKYFLIHHMCTVICGEGG